MAKTHEAAQNVSDNSVHQEQLTTTSHTQPATCIQSMSNDQPSIQPESCSSAPQMDAPGTDSASTSATRRSFAELMPLPKRSRATTKRPRAKPPSYQLTSDEHFQFIAEKGSRGPKTKKPRQNLKPAKVPLKSKKPLDQAVYCLYCNESFDESTGKWVQCTKCKKWAEYDCAGSSSARLCMQTAEDENRQFVLDTLWYSQPVHVAKK